MICVPGDALLAGDTVLEAQRLWDGPLTPEMIPAVELVLRALLAEKRLFTNHPRLEQGKLSEEIVFEVPVQENLSLPKREFDHLEFFVDSALSSANGPIDYRSGEPFVLGIDAGMDKLLKAVDYARVPTLISAITLVSAHRGGRNVYSDSWIARICNEFIFHHWPRKLFEQFNEEYARASDLISRAGISIDLPPLTALVLSRAPTRDAIPTVIRELRSEYETSRTKLWTLIEEAQNAERLKDQLDALSCLQGAAAGLFDAAFPKRTNVLSLALDLAAGQFAEFGKRLLEQNEPKARVGSVSFAAKLAKDLRRDLLSHKSILKRHLSKSELKQFGLG